MLLLLLLLFYFFIFFLYFFVFFHLFFILLSLSLSFIFMLFFDIFLVQNFFSFILFIICYFIFLLLDILSFINIFFFYSLLHYYLRSLIFPSFSLIPDSPSYFDFTFSQSFDNFFSCFLFPCNHFSQILIFLSCIFFLNILFLCTRILLFMFKQSYLGMIVNYIRLKDL